MRTLPRYFVAGGIAGLFDFLFFLLFNTLLGFYYLWVGISGFILATFINYWLSILFVFNSGARFSRRTEIISVYVVSLVGLLLHALILAIAIEKFVLPGPIAKILATGSVFIWNYTARHYYVFRAKSENS
jgi:putative flippase GtrA